METNIFVKLMLSQATEDLVTSDPEAFIFFYHIVKRAWKQKDPSPKGLEFGQAFIGDWRTTGCRSRQHYRELKKRLFTTGQATFHGTNKGTVATIIKTDIFNLFMFGNNEQNNQQHNQTTTIQQPSNNHPTTTNRDIKSSKREERREEESARARDGELLSEYLFFLGKGEYQELDRDDFRAALERWCEFVFEKKYAPPVKSQIRAQLDFAKKYGAAAAAECIALAIAGGWQTFTKPDVAEKCAGAKMHFADADEDDCRPCLGEQTAEHEAEIMAAKDYLLDMRMKRWGKQTA